MKRISDKRRRLLAAAEPIELDYCYWCSVESGQCFKGFPVQLEEHHVARGQNRERALGKDFCRLVLCSRCHDDLHRLAGDAQICVGLALIRYRNPEHYSLSKYYELTGRRWPDEQDVELWWRRLFEGRRV